MTKVKFVPNTSSAETNEQIVTQHAEKVLQNPEVIVMVPLAEVEAAITTSETNAQLVNVCAGEVSYSPVETETLGPMSGHHLPPEKPSALGEKIAGELDKLEDEDYFFTSDYVWTRRQPHQYPDGTPVVSVEAVITAGE